MATPLCPAVFVLQLGALLHVPGGSSRCAPRAVAPCVGPVSPLPLLEASRCAWPSAQGAAPRFAPAVRRGAGQPSVQALCSCCDRLLLARRSAFLSAIRASACCC